MRTNPTPSDIDRAEQHLITTIRELQTLLTVIENRRTPPTWRNLDEVTLRQALLAALFSFGSLNGKDYGYPTAPTPPLWTGEPAPNPALSLPAPSPPPDTSGQGRDTHGLLRYGGGR